LGQRFLKKIHCPAPNNRFFAILLRLINTGKHDHRTDLTVLSADNFLAQLKTVQFREQGSGHDKVRNFLFEDLECLSSVRGRQEVKLLVPEEFSDFVQGLLLIINYQNSFVHSRVHLVAEQTEYRRFEMIRLVPSATCST